MFVLNRLINKCYHSISFLVYVLYLKFFSLCALGNMQKEKSILSQEFLIFVNNFVGFYFLGSRYIKRYRNEEEKLLDMLNEREAVIKSAIKQGQELRAKCNRYKDELDR